MDERLKVGDTIKYKDADDMLETMTELARQHIDTDFLYEKDGQKGYWLIITKVGRRWT